MIFAKNRVYEFACLMEKSDFRMFFCVCVWNCYVFNVLFYSVLNFVFCTERVCVVLI